MRKSPINYLVAIAVFLVYWFLTGFLLSNVLAENIPLMNMLPNEWRIQFLIFTGITTGLTLILTIIWFIYGSGEARVEALDKAKSVWQILFFSVFTISIVLFIIFVMMLVKEEITLKYYVITFIVFLSQSLGLFWLTSFFFSPSNVEFIPYGK